MITGKIDVSKIDQKRLFPGKNGAAYCDFVFFTNREGPDRNGWDGFIAQSVSKEEREAGVRGPIIGNWKNFESGRSGNQPRPQADNPKPANARPLF